MGGFSFTTIGLLMAHAVRYEDEDLMEDLAKVILGEGRLGDEARTATNDLRDKAQRLIDQMSDDLYSDRSSGHE